MLVSQLTTSILALALASGPPIALEAKSPKTQKVTADKTVKILSDEESKKYLPSPTPVPKFEFPDKKEIHQLPQIIELTKT